MKNQGLSTIINKRTKNKLWLSIVFLFIIDSPVFAFQGSFQEPENNYYTEINENDYYRVKHYRSKIGFVKTLADGSQVFAFQVKNNENYEAFSNYSRTNKNPASIACPPNSQKVKAEVVYGPFNLNGINDFFLSFWYLWDTESNLAKDIMTVEISTSDNPGSYKALLDNKTIRDHHPENTWAAMKDIDISGYKGQNVYIKFTFDSVDHCRNSHKGWLIDNINIYSNQYTSVFKPKTILDITFDEKNDSGSVFQDYSGNNFHALSKDPIKRGTDSKNQISGYVTINKNQYIYIPEPKNMDELSAFAMDFWIRPEQLFGIIASREDHFIVELTDEGKIQLTFYHTLQKVLKSGISVNGQIVKDDWNHVAVIYDGENIGFYINNKYSPGNMLYEKKKSYTPKGPLYIGRSNDSSSKNFYHGAIAEFRMADISTWMFSKIKIKHRQKPIPVYNLSLYDKPGWYMVNPEIEEQDEFYGGDYDPERPLIKKFIKAIGIDDTTPSFSDSDKWEKIQKIWDYFHKYEITEEDPRFQPAWDFIWSTPEWADVTRRAEEFDTFNGFVWAGTCGARTQYFAMLMRIAGIPKSHTAGATANWLYMNTEFATHVFNIIYIDEEWIAIDPSTSNTNTNKLPYYPASHTKINKTIDYELPHNIQVSKDMNFDRIPLINAPYTTYLPKDPLSKIKLTSPPEKLLTKDNEILIMGRYKKSPDELHEHMPDYATVCFGECTELTELIKIPVDVSDPKYVHFIASLPVNFIEDSLKFTIKYGFPGKLETKTVTIWDINIMPQD